MVVEFYDCRNYSAEEILAFMIKKNPALRHRAQRRRVYVGASGNVADRLYRHKALERLLFCARTAHRNVAAAVERIAREMGFNIGNVGWGGCGTNSHSIYVYAYKMSPSTIE